IDAPPDAELRHDASVDASPDACVPLTTELLINPAFDLAPLGMGWTEVPIDPMYPVVSSTGVSQSAPYEAWMGGIVATTGTVPDQVYQAVPVPANTSQLVIGGFYLVGTAETGSFAYDTGSLDLVQTNGTPIENVMSLSNLTTTGSSYQPFVYGFSADVSGQ